MSATCTRPRAADMLLALLLVTQVACEWVEISQQNYAKPFRPARIHPSLTTLAKEVERTTRANRIYINNSLPDYNWNKGGFKVGERVQFDSGTLKSNEQNIFGDKIETNSEIKQKYGYNYDDMLTPNNALVKNDKTAANIDNRKGSGNRFSNTDDVHRIQASGTEDHRIIFNNKYINRPIEILNLSDLEYATEEVFTTIELDDDISDNSKTKYFTHMTENAEEMMPKKNRFATNNKPVNKEIIQKDNKIYVSAKETSMVAEFGDIGIKLHNESKVKPIHPTSSTETSSTGQDNYEKLTTIKNSKPISANREIFSNGELRDGGPLKETAHRHPNIGQIKRVQIVPKPTADSNKSNTNNNKNYDVTGSTILPNSISVTSIPKVPNIGKTKRVHVSTTEKTTTRRTKMDKNRLNSYETIKRVIVPNPEAVMIEELLKESEEQVTDKTPKGQATGTVKRVQHVSGTQSNYKFKEPHVVHTRKETSTNGKQSSNSSYRNNTSTIADFKQVQMTSTEAMPEPIAENVSSTKHYIIESEQISTTEREYDHIKVIDKSNPFVTKEETFSNDQTSEIPVIKDDVKTNRNQINTETRQILGADSSKVHETKYSDEKSKKTTQDRQTPKDKDQNEGSKLDEIKVNNTKANPMESLVRLLKIVTETISKNTRRTFKGKLSYLEDLRDTILANIEERIESAFPDDEPSDGARARRRARAAQASPRGHVEFPSSESALMTISFLTFAVFLIKLVLQLLQIYKDKTVMMPAVVATVGRAVGEFRSRDLT